MLSEVKVSNLSGVSETALMKLNKGPLARITTSLVNVFEVNVSICKLAAEKIDELNICTDRVVAETFFARR